MLINKLIQRIISPQIKLNTPYFLLAKEKPQKTKEAPKQAKSPSKDAPKAEGKSAKGAGKTKASSDGKKQQKPVQPMPVSFTNQTNSGSLYRGIVKKVQIKTKTGRAKFNDEDFKKIVNIAGPKDLNLIFECYYNYVGHHTVLTNRAVDTLLNKAISLGSENKQLQEQALNYILEIYKSHEYLSYYPHYDTTIKVAKYAARLNKFPAVLNILNDKLLIKLNRDSVKQLCFLATEWKDFTTLIKILAFRFNRGLIIDITNVQLVGYIAQGIKNNKTVRFTKPSLDYNKLLSSIDQPSVNLAVAWLVASERDHKATSVLKKLDEKDPNIKSLVETFLKLKQGKINSSIKAQFKQLLQKSAYSSLLK